MGTSFYAKQIISESEYKEIEDAIAQRQLKCAKALIELYNEAREYHIGKRSSGWQFIFEPEPWEPNLQSIKDFLNRPDIEIYDEYGKKFTVDQFWNEEVGESLYNNPEKYINGVQYDQKEQNRYPMTMTPYEFTSEDGIRFYKT